MHTQAYPTPDMPPGHAARVKLALVLLALPACDGCGSDPNRHIIDSPHAGSDSTVFHDAALVDASNPNSVLFVTQSPPGPDNGNQATWAGVLQFSITGDGSPLVAEAGIVKTELADPIDLAFQSKTSEIYVSNRHGNNAADGVAGSISRYAYDQATHGLTQLAPITGNGLAGPHQIVFSPTTGELFAGNVDNSISRFTFDASGAAIANGTIGTGLTRGVFVSPDGKRLYATAASATIRQFDLATNTELTPVTITAPANPNLHFFGYRLGDLYVAALDLQKVYRYHLEANDDLTFVEAIDASSPIGISFSADGMEMFVTGHRTSDLVQRYTFDGTTWQPAGTQDLGVSLGGILLVPG